MAGEQFDLLVSNPPYIAADDPTCNKATRFEPAGALTDFADGLSCIRQLIAGAPPTCAPAAGC